MKRTYFIIFFLICLVTIYHFYRFDYDIEYSIKKYNVNEHYSRKNKIISFKIINNDKEYYFEVNRTRFLNKKIITKINEINDEKFNCIIIESNKIKTYPLCYEDNIYKSYLLIDSDKLDKYKNEDTKHEISDNNFEYYNNLSNNEYIALWKYNGFYLMNNDSIKNVDIFTKDRYSNDLTIMINEKILLPNYDEGQYFKSFIVFNVITGKYEKIESKFEIYYDSYYAGNYKNSVYLFDNKTNSLYEINIKNMNITIISNGEDDYIKIENGKKVIASLKDYTKKKITYFNNKKLSYNYNFEAGSFKELPNKLLLKISNNKINIVKDSFNDVYYSDQNYFYKYNDYNGIKTIFYDFELNFNSDNRIFVYVK